MPPLIAPLGPQGAGLDRRLPEWELSLMTDGAKSVLEAFESLPELEREEVLTELMRRVAHGDYNSPDDQELVEAAERVFTEYDRRESQD